MPLESLLQPVKTLSDRIQQHGDALRKNEALTRYALIDPLLRELGWDTENPDQVQPEYKAGTGRSDYALLHDGKAVIMVEAKSLDTTFHDNVLAQGIQYCLMQGTPYFAVTDGRRWEVYETHKPTPIDQKRVVAFDLASGNESCFVLTALVLWRPSVESGSVTTAQTPIVGLPSPAPTDPAPPQHSAGDGELPVISRAQLGAMPDGQLILCPAKPNGVEFLTTHNAWGFIRVNTAPKYLALYISQPVSAIEYVGEVDRVIDPAKEPSPVGTEHEAYKPGRKLVALKNGGLWRLAEPVTFGLPNVRGKAPQGPRYLSLSKLADANTLDDLGGPK